MTKLFLHSLMLAFLLLSCAACTGAPTKPLPVVAGEPVIVTHTEYRQIPDTFFPAIEPPVSATTIWSGGDLYGAWLHDSGELGKCGPALQAIRTLTRKP